MSKDKIKSGVLCVFRGETKTRLKREKREGKEWEAGQWEGRKGAGSGGRGRVREGLR